MTIILLASSIVSLVAFLYWEARVESPLIPVSPLRKRNIMIANIGIPMAASAIQLMMQADTYILQMPEPIGFGKTILETGLPTT